MDSNPLDHGELMHIYTDGASRGNPGEGACAYVFTTTDGTVFEKDGEYLGETTNNRAEYQAIKLALDDAVSVHRGPIVLHSDSQLVIKQINGEYRVKSDNLKSLYDEILSLTNRYDDLEFRYVPRDNTQIGKADDHCNELLDQATGNQS